MKKTQDVLCFPQDQAVPKRFARGQTLAFIMELPANVEAGKFWSWIPTCQLRRMSNTGPAGLIAEIDCRWTSEEAIAIEFFHRQTDEWPVGPAEFDVLFTSPTGHRSRSLPIGLEITPGITLVEAPPTEIPE